MAEDATGLDQWLSGQGLDQASDQKRAADAAAARKKQSDTKKANATLAQFRNAAEEAAKALQTATFDYKQGGMTKDRLNGIYKAYVTAQDQLYTMDAPGAAQIQTKYFPQAKAPATTTEQAAPSDVSKNVNGVAPTIVFDKNGNPVKNSDGSYKTAVGATAPDATPAKAPAASVVSSNPFQTITSSDKQVQGPLLPADEAARWAKNYGAIGAMALTIPWMANILKDAASQGWNAQKFTQEVKSYKDPTSGQSPWDALGAAYRDSTLAYYDNKAAWGQQYNDKLTILQQSAIRQGLDPAAFGTQIDLTDPKAIDAAYKDQHSGVNSFFNAFYNNMPDMGVIDKYVSNHTTLAKTDQNVYAGIISQNVDALKSYANDMGVASQYLPKVQGSTGDYFGNAAKLIQDGNTTLQEQQNYIKDQAISMYAPFANRIKEGMSVKALASPYVNAASNLLENQDQTAFDLSSTTGYGSMITKAMQGDGQTPMALDKFVTSIKQRPEWLQTSNARNSLMDTATQLLRNFGMVTGG